MAIRFLCILMCLVLSHGMTVDRLSAQSAATELTIDQENATQEKAAPPAKPVPIESTATPQTESPATKAAEAKPPEAKSADSKSADSKSAELKSEVAPYSSPQTDQPKEPDAAKKPEPAAVAPRIHSTALLPIATKAWFSVPNINLLEEQFDKTQYGELAKQPSIKPFVDSIKQQAQDWLDDKNVRLGVKVDDIDQIHTGEICVAGVMQDLEGGQPARGSHGLILLVDVAGNEAQVAELLARVNADLGKKKGAVQEELEINGVPVTKITIKNPKRIRHAQFSFQTTHNGWLLVADNEEIFRDIMRRLAAPDKIRRESTLSQYEPYTEIMKQTELFNNSAHFSWYVDPFGYLKLVQKIKEEEQDVRRHQDDWPRILSDQGFDAIRGMGGNIALSVNANDQNYELLNRAFVYAPRESLNENQKQMFDLFDFQPGTAEPPIPAKWVPFDSSGYFSANWNFSKLLKSFGHVYDAFVGEDGEFDRMIEDFKTEPDFQLDLVKIVGMMDDRFSIISTTERPVTEDSERMVVGLRLKNGGDPEFIFRSIKRAVGRKHGKQINLAGFDVIEVDTTIESDPYDLEDDLQLPPGFEDLDNDPDAAPAKQPEKFSLFKKRYFVVHQNYLLMANDKIYLKKLLTVQQETQLHQTDDYLQMYGALEKVTDAKKVSFRQFARVDRALETNYEMLRRGEMAKSQTVLAKILNKIFEPDDKQPIANQAPRSQKLDGSKLPADFEKSVAPYLGPSGWVMETERNGWRVTGCTLKKKPMNEVVKKAANEEESAGSQR